MKKGLGIIMPMLFILGSAWSANIKVYPYDEANVLAGQRFDLRIEASGLQGNLEASAVLLDGQPLQGLTQTSQGAGQSEWTLRGTFIRAGSHTLTVSVTDGIGQTKRTVNWVARQNARLPRAPKNVIVFIGDGMGWNVLNGARIIAKGYSENGVPKGLLEMQTDPSGSATVTTSSLDSYIVDSANSASSIATGQKIEVNALGVYPDNTKDTLDNPRIETIAEMMKRVRGASIGVVTNTFGTDATPAAWSAHTRRRGDYAAIADQYFKSPTPLDVMLFGGSEDFIPQSAQGSRRKDNTDWIAQSQQLGYSFVSSRTELLKQNNPAKLFGLFNTDNFPSYLDRAVWRRPEVLGNFSDMPYLWEMTQKAVESLSKNDKGFFLMVESGMIDKYLHPLDWVRGMFDVLEMDRAVSWAKEWAKTRGDTLIIVTADHAHPLSVFAGYDNSKGPGNREAVGVYEKAGFPTYGDQLDPNGIPLPSTARTLAVGFGATPDYCETFGSREVFQPPTVSDGQGGYKANPQICSEPGAYLRVGNLPKDTSQGVHSADPVPLYAFGPGGENFRNTLDQTDIFFLMAQALGLNPYLEAR